MTDPVQQASYYKNLLEFAHLFSAHPAIRRVSSSLKRAEIISGDS